MPSAKHEQTSALRCARHGGIYGIDAPGRAMGAATCEDSNRYRVFVNAEGRVIVQKLD